MPILINTSIGPEYVISTNIILNSKISFSKILSRSLYIVEDLLSQSNKLFLLFAIFFFPKKEKDGLIGRNLLFGDLWVSCFLSLGVFRQFISYPKGKEPYSERVRLRENTSISGKYKIWVLRGYYHKCLSNKSMNKLQ